MSLIISRDALNGTPGAAIHWVPIKLVGSIGGHSSLGEEAQDRMMPKITTNKSENKSLVFIVPPENNCLTIVYANPSLEANFI